MVSYKTKCQIRGKFCGKREHDGFGMCLHVREICKWGIASGEALKYGYEEYEWR